MLLAGFLAVFLVATEGAIPVGSTGVARGAAEPIAGATATIRGVANAGPARLAFGRAAPARPPTDPPAPVCGSSRLRGPAKRPAGAVAVTPERNLREVVLNRPPNTTFWLAPGIHRLSRDTYDQVTPKGGDRFIGAPGAVLDGQHANRYAFGGSAPDVHISHLTIRGFGHPAGNNNEGVVNHDAATGWTMRHNTVTGNAGAGIFVGSRNIVAGNCLRGNGQYGLSAYSPHGVRNIVIRHNEIAFNNTDDWEALLPGCGCTGGAKFWSTKNAAVVRNWVHDNHGVGLWMDNNNTGFRVEGNLIDRNAAEGIFYETSYNALIRYNSFVHNGLVAGPRNPGFPTPALYISESGSDPRAGARYSDRFRVTHNRFVNNWSGVIAWENADRFAGSPANTSTGSTTLVNPQATVTSCSDAQLIQQRPYYDDCRWKTKRLRIAHNVFRFDPSALGPDCTASRGCGYVGVFSNWGTYPSWSPFQGEVVMDAITFRQNNKWHHNAYLGPWRYMVHQQGNRVTWRVWRSAPFLQDRGSTRRG